MDEHLIDRNSARIDMLERLFEQKFASNDEALKVALRSNDLRLDAMNEFRGAITDITTKMITRVEALNVLEATAKKTDADVDMLRDRMELAARPNYPLIIGLMSVAATLVAGIWLIVGLKIDTSVAPLDNRMVALETRVTTLNNSVTTAYDRIATIKNDVSKVASAEIEIETQFCANDIVRNLIHANDLRAMSMLWNRSNPRDKFPTDNAYYPQVCNRASSVPNN